MYWTSKNHDSYPTTGLYITAVISAKTNEKNDLLKTDDVYAGRNRIWQV